MSKYVIGLIFDNKGQYQLRDMLKKMEIENNNVNDFHISVADFECDDEEYIINKVKTFAQKLKKFSVKFSSIGFFLNSDNTLFLNPVISNELLSCHRQIKNHIEKDTVAETLPNYQNNSYVPHCSLAFKITDNEFWKALRFLKSQSSCIVLPTVMIDKIDIVKHDNKYEKLLIVELKC